MSFFTSLSYYRPGSPPPVTADDLAQFIARIRDTNTLSDHGLRLLHVKFGDAIDQDDKGTSWEEETVPGISVIQDIEWDIHLSDDPSHEDIINALVSDRRRVYRALVMLGMPIEDILRPLTRENSLENEIDFCPDGLSIEIGPIECFNLASEQPLHVGWISLAISGGGYLFPWTFRDVFDRLQRLRKIQRLSDACQSFWPIPEKPPEPRIVQLRKEFKELWPYDEFDKPWDWYWGLQETG